MFFIITMQQMKKNVGKFLKISENLPSELDLKHFINEIL